ncbi:MAG: zinc ABC transporter substrate-binding protein, partial [Moraxellaceae bacterium]|nr:zinc ABC transporter substrate-binding protein [Moraxellaceae bacterium]
MFRYLLALLLVLPLSARALDVVASIRPLALIADAVMEGQGRAHQLVPNGASSHEYALRPSDRALLARADLVLWVGPVHEHFLPTALRGRDLLT